MSFSGNARKIPEGHKNMSFRFCPDCSSASWLVVSKERVSSRPDIASYIDSWESSVGIYRLACKESSVE